MTAKELLAKIIKLRKAIDYRNTKIASLVAQAENTSCRLTGMPHNPSPDPSPMATAICKKVDLENEIEKLEAERNGYIAMLDLLEDTDFSRILNLRYVQEAKWDDIMAEMCYSPSWIFELHNRARKKLDEILKDRSKKE